MNRSRMSTVRFAVLSLHLGSGTASGGPSELRRRRHLRFGYCGIDSAIGWPTSFLSPEVVMIDRSERQCYMEAMPPLVIGLTGSFGSGCSEQFQKSA